MDHGNQLPRLSKIEGQIKGIKKMIEEKRYCMDILIQIKSVTSALSKVRNNILKEHMQHCVKESLLSDSESDAQDKINELAEYLNKMF